MKRTLVVVICVVSASVGVTLAVMRGRLSPPSPQMAPVHEPVAQTDGCEARGRFDRAVAPQLGTGEGNLVQGWVIAPAGATLQLDTGFAMPIQASEDRRDVASAFPHCAAALHSGFTVRLPVDAVADKAWIVVAHPKNGATRLDEIVLPKAPLRLELDAMDDVEPNGLNVVSGWALASDRQPVTINVLAEDRVVAQSTTGHSRADVAAALPGEGRAAKSGFDIRIPFETLPRGDYPLVIEARAADGIAHARRTGPHVRNAYPYAVALTLWDKRRNPSSLKVAVWAAHERGVKSVDLTTSASKKTFRMVRQRSNAPFFARSTKEIVRHMTPPIHTGDIWVADIPNTLADGVHRLGARVVARDGHEAWIPAQLVVNDHRARRAPARCRRDPLLVFYPTGPGTSAGLGPQREATALKSLVAGPCVTVGMRIRVEYLRTTAGARNDYAFDAFFDSQHTRVNGRAMTTAGLNESLELARRYRMPILISLDGGVWADSAFEAPEWDVVDMLERDDQLVQWNQFDKSEKDDALTGLSGAMSSPQLARMMSLNVFNERFRAYKKRNLQAAIAFIRRYEERHPGMDVWVNFDSDNYINPWFKDRQWYDYNPKTIAQFRQWLTGQGIYASELNGLARRPALSLPQINELAGAHWVSIDEVDAPRGPLDPSSRWYQTWVEFKRHVVAQHYADLAHWACDAGMPKDRLYTAVGISDSTVAVEQDDPLGSWNDQSGVSIRGGKPPCGHLGVVVYGPASRGELLHKDGKSPLVSAAEVDPAYGVVEFHAANLDVPNRLPTNEESRQTMQSLTRASRFISPMWGGVASGQTLAPGNFRAYEAMEGTDFEYQLVEQLRALNRHTCPADAGRRRAAPAGACRSDP